MHYIVFSVAFVFAFLVAIVASLTLIAPYVEGGTTAMNVIYGCCHASCSEEIDLACPLLLGKKQSKTVTVSITNPYLTDEEYSGSIQALVLKQGEYYKEDVCDERIIVPSGQTESFACELHPQSVEGVMTWVRVRTRPSNQLCGTNYAICGVQAYYWLYCLLPFVVAAPFAWWFFKIKKGIQSG